LTSHQKLKERLVFAEKIIRETPIVRLEAGHIELYAKLEFLNGLGSIKDRPAFWILKGAIEVGEVGPHDYAFIGVGIVNLTS
jgi:N-(2-amino-2-carboxyethyl)-L-glutamate synthase